MRRIPLLSHGEMMKPAPSLLTMVAVLTFLPAVFLSHHSMATYDQTTLRAISGVISKIEWQNPHSWITLTVASADGRTVAQTIEIAGPRTLAMRGFDRTTLQIGQAVTIDSWMPKDPGSTSSPSGRTLILAGGQRFDVGEGNWLENQPAR